MTELELRRNGAKHAIRVPEGVPLDVALRQLEQWDREWSRGKRKYG